MKKILKNKTILITGGTGFLGQSLAKELIKYAPKSIRLFSRDEFKHQQVHEKFGFKFSGGILRHLIGDVRDYDRLKRAMKGCDIVIHAAALKRIDMIEYNVEEVIKTNVQGTLNLVNAALENDVKKVIFVSTDKACSPVNTYGACKFIGERIITESNFNKGTSKTVFSCVRYGNVINSTGSVFPLFIDKIKNGKKIPLTSGDMTRFFITPKGAVNLIFKAIKYGGGGEIFVPKLPSVKMDNLIFSLKKSYNTNNPVEIIGLRPGEKIHEQMINDAEAHRTYDFGNTFVITSQIEKYQEYAYKYLKKSKKVKFETYSSGDNVLKGEKLDQFISEIKPIFEKKKLK
jgi:UDP-N-acetylglucosamine 4,6-dehydratase/5-epimerase